MTIITISVDYRPFDDDLREHLNAASALEMLLVGAARREAARLAGETRIQSRIEYDDATYERLERVRM
jgi:hypothetical protein